MTQTPDYVFTLLPSPENESPTSDDEDDSSPESLESQAVWSAPVAAPPLLKSGAKWADLGVQETRWAPPAALPLWMPASGGGGDRHDWRDDPGSRQQDPSQQWAPNGGRQAASRYHLSAAVGQGWSSTRRECLPHVLEAQDRYICDEFERMVCLSMFERMVV